jgi:hypothetical protein
MKPFERILIIVLLAFCAIMLAMITANSLGLTAAGRARAEYAETIRTQTTQNLTDMQTVLDGYQKAAYGGGDIDRISEQQLLASETTNVLLAKAINQLALLTLLLVP